MADTDLAILIVGYCSSWLLLAFVANRDQKKYVQNKISAHHGQIDQNQSKTP